MKTMKTRATIHWLAGVAGGLLLTVPALVWAPPGGLKLRLDICEDDLVWCLDELEACGEEPCVIFPGDGQTGPELSYTDNGDGTFTDDNTGLIWEIKTGTEGEPIDCNIDPELCIAGHDVKFLYSWSSTGSEPDGLAFTLHLMNLNQTCGGHGGYASYCDNNDDCAASPITHCGLGGHTDWRLPTLKELQSLVDYSVPFPGPTVSSDLPGSTASTSAYWSYTSFAGQYTVAWAVNFGVGSNYGTGKTFGYHVRAVRGGW